MLLSIHLVESRFVYLLLFFFFCFFFSCFFCFCFLLFFFFFFFFFFFLLLFFLFLVVFVVIFFFFFFFFFFFIDELEVLHADQITCIFNTTVNNLNHCMHTVVLLRQMLYFPISLVWFVISPILFHTHGHIYPFPLIQTVVIWLKNCWKRR